MPGRYQLGQEVALTLLCTDASGTPTNPVSAPHADIFRGSTKVLSGLLFPVLDAGSTTGLFQRNVFLGNLFSTGRHQVVFRYLVGSYLGQVTDDFEILAGGDPDGAVIAAHWYERPHAGFVVQQKDSGKLIKGRNPTV